MSEEEDISSSGTTGEETSSEYESGSDSGSSSYSSSGSGSESDSGSESESESDSEEEAVASSPPPSQPPLSDPGDQPVAPAEPADPRRLWERPWTLEELRDSVMSDDWTLASDAGVRFLSFLLLELGLCKLLMTAAFKYHRPIR